ncbi:MULTISPECIES: DUF2157 domain-containing protein [unclassified Arsukibacterium]|mgnify:CR=1 FL=1|uniref:DUF2157 domain-containing protein n=1 Tax=unclassified Arsukibacterium TaxID=2635278 RepID=UPI000C481E03|nr:MULTISPECIES: DUF2157 domain-containing protein [unclassified Arsukibacterium]MAA96150.1 hypothetical protein [Rheinheimera sp.]MBM34341.1 hypothetical protein [Rheinheimera sp.]HAW93450.1 hypothetical protein [Candidatus Azambacteria bacterium]|tara:strand:+ start:890 stop:2005 length:1116 start_codon:yes stop_codon:yes gene_type:complete
MDETKHVTTTPPFNKTQAQARADQVLAFRAEQQILAEQGVLILADDKAAQVRDYHDALLQQMQQEQNVDLNAQARHLSLGMQIVSFLGATALAASLFFLFFQYWGYFSTVSQVALLIAAPLLSLALAVWLQRVDGSGYYAKLAALVSFTAWVLNIIMLGSIFNITPSANAFAVFALYGFVLAYLLHVRLLLAAAILCSFMFIGAQFGSWMGSYLVHAGEYPEHFLLASAMFFAVPMAFKQQRFDGFANIYQTLSAVVFFIAVLVLANWGRVSYLPWSADLVEGVYQVVGFVASALLLLFGIRTHAAKLMLTGNVFFALFLYTKFFDWWWDWLPKYLFFLLVGLTAILALTMFNRFRAIQHARMQSAGGEHV